MEILGILAVLFIVGLVISAFRRMKELVYGLLGLLIIIACLAAVL